MSDYDIVRIDELLIGRMLVLRDLANANLAREFRAKWGYWMGWAA